MVKLGVKSKLLKKIISPHTVKARSHLAKMIKGQKSTIGKGFQRDAGPAYRERTREAIRHQLATAAARDVAYRRVLAAAIGSVGTLSAIGVGFAKMRKKKS